MADYTRDYHFMMLSALAYKDEAQILQDIRDCKPGSALPPGWEVLKGSGREDGTSGFAAVSFVNKHSGEIVMAFRGSEGPFLANIDWRGPDAALASPFKAWNPQFEQALQYARDIQHTYGAGYDYAVTGHSLGGALAQIAGKMYGLDGRTFDAPGVGNVVAAGQFHAYAVASGRAATGEGVPATFVNYTVNRSLLGYAGQWEGQRVPVSGTSGRAWWESPLNDVLGNWPGEIAARHSYTRLLDVFERAAKTGRLDQIGLGPAEPAPLALGDSGNRESSAWAGVADRLPPADRTQLDELRGHLQARGIDAASVDNVAAALLANVRAMPHMQRVDDVVVQDAGGAGRVFAVYMPHGDQAPVFRAHVDLLTAANTPARASLEPLLVTDAHGTAQREDARQRQPTQA